MKKSQIVMVVLVLVAVVLSGFTAFAEDTPAFDEATINQTKVTLVANWVGALTHETTGNSRRCTMRITDQGTPGKIHLVYSLAGDRGKPAVNDSPQECPIIERYGHIGFEFTSSVSNASYFFYIDGKGTLKSIADSANYAVNKFELRK